MGKRILLLLLCSVMVFSIVTGCSQNGESSGTTDEGNSGNADATGDEQQEITITVAMWPNETDEAGLALKDEQMAKMNELYPHITVEVQRWPYDVKSFLPMAEAGQLATVYSTYFTEPDKIIGGGYAADITSVMQDWGYDQSISQELLDLVSRDGKIYGIPYSAYTMGVHYNVALMEQAGLVDADGKPLIAKTWDDILDFSIQIKETTGQAGFSLPSQNNQGGWQFLNIAWGFGAEFQEQDEDGNWKAIFNSPEAVEAMQWVKDLKWKHNVIPDLTLLTISEQGQFFAADQLAMKLRDSGAANEMTEQWGMDPNNLAMSAMPGGKAGSFAQMGGSIYMFSPNATDAEIDAAFKWLEIGETFTSKTDDISLENLENSLIANVEANRIVGLYSIPPIWIGTDRFEKELALRTEHANVDLGLYESYHNSSDTVTINPEPPVNVQEMYKLIDNVIQAVWSDENTDIQQIMDKAVTDFQRDYLDPYNAGDIAE